MPTYESYIQYFVILLRGIKINATLLICISKIISIHFKMGLTVHFYVPIIFIFKNTLEFFFFFALKRSTINLIFF